MLLILAVLMNGAAASQSRPPPCNDNLYCYGALLHTVQMSEIYEDSKTFVDMKVKTNRNTTWASFEKMMNRTGNRPTPEDVARFVNETFDPAGSEFEEWVPPDWKTSPRFLENISDSDLRNWGSRLNDLWKLLGRKMKQHVHDNQELYSIIYVRNPVIIPGGRFREFYYWDSYWIIRGLLLSEMYATAKGMLENFVSIVDRFGFVPNGGRRYYSMRSQPPLLTPTVDSYIQATNDNEFLKRHINSLEKEMEFWLKNRTLSVEKDGKTYLLARYNDMSSGPRPESYQEDTLSASVFKTEKEKDAFYSELKTAAESGWDFSSRWYITNATNQGNLTSIHIKDLIPVDLNAIICWNFNLLSKFNQQLNRPENAKKFAVQADKWRVAVEEVLWHEEVGAWLDYDWKNQIKRDYFHLSNLAPLWTGCYDPARKSYYLGLLLEYLSKNNVMDNPGGLPTTTHSSGEQWDYPNAWPPLQHIAIMGLDSTGDARGISLAFEIARRWVRTNYVAFNHSNAMFEKYDASVVGVHGSGGEYDVQLGFGWTNGVIMDLLAKYGDLLTVNQVLGTEEPFSSAQKVAHLLTIVAAQSTLAALVP